LISFVNVGFGRRETMRLEGKIAIVTGSSGGLGEAIALNFAREGATVVAVARREDRIIDLVSRIEALGGKGLAYKADLLNEAEVEALMKTVHEKYGRIDALVNCAAVATNTKEIPQFIKPFEEITESEWDFLMASNIKTVFFCCKHVSPYMKEQEAGSIINISSTTAWIGAPLFLHYTTSRGAILSLTKGLANIFAPFKVRVNTVCPGQVLTESTISYNNGNKEATEKQILGKQPLQIVTQAEDISGIVVYLASDESRVTTGQAIGVNGGGFFH